MSKNTVERTNGGIAVTCKADATVDLAKGEGVVFVTGSYLVTNIPDQNTPAQGIALEAHSSGVYECIPVLIPGPVVRIVASGAVTAGQFLNASATTMGQWVVDAGDPAGIALEDADDGDELDMCFVGQGF